ncbi:MAG: ABC transporter ATP-binding protein [Acidobacteria bacterium]|nr:ABC transporter ATP-binding protein [Acidobacteriota bacterium]
MKATDAASTPLPSRRAAGADDGSAPEESPPILEIEDLRISVAGSSQRRTSLVESVSLTLFPGERAGIIGESGSGKSLTAMAALDLVPPPARIATGKIVIDGVNLLNASEREQCRIRGGVVGLIPQEPATALNPVFSMGFQLAEVIRLHRSVSRREARAAALDLLARTGLHPPAGIARAYAHQLSGGQMQRAVIALALAGQPRLLIADEPTTALDALTTQSILALLDGLVNQTSLALLLITHDLGVVSSAVDRVLIMYAGEIVEEGRTPHVFNRPLHPYTRALLRIAREIRNPREGTRRLSALPGTIPAPGTWETGCRFAPRCPEARDACFRRHPELLGAGPGRKVRCLFPLGGGIR